MNARDEILARIRAAGSPPSPAPARDYQRADALSPGETLSKFISRITDYGVLVTEVADETAVTDAVREICAARGIGHLVTSPDCPGLWQPQDVMITTDRGSAIPAALTGAACAIAETGTVILDGEFAQGRRAISLLADFHLCVVFAAQIVECVSAAIAQTAAAARAGRPFTFISGPSATADIEFDRVQGVHGPRQLDVIIVRSGAAAAPGA
jgi:L-lactate dehydrogenase complex protein LldG